MIKLARHIPVAACLALLALIAGCLQVETRVTLHEDGSATIAERVQFSKRLLEFRTKQLPKEGMAAFLSRESVLKRVKQMGKGARLVSHKIQDGEKGSRESIAVFKIPKIVDLRYVSPFLGTPDYAKHHVVRCRELPMYRNTWDGKRAGYLAVQFTAGGRGGKVAYKVASPATLQMFRHLRPVFQDMMKGFALKFEFEGYSAVGVRRAGQRGRRARTTRACLIDVSSEDLDQYGSSFFGNEEAMVELLQMQINGPNVRRNCAGFSENLTIPLFRFGASAPEIIFPPSPYYFDKYFKGKMLDFGRDGTRQADPRKDIYRPGKAAKKSGG